MINKPELLAPAGDLERLKIALLYGADQHLDLELMLLILHLMN